MSKLKYLDWTFWLCAAALVAMAICVVLGTTGCATVRNPICLFNCGDKQIWYPPK